MPYIPTMPKNRTLFAIGAALLIPLAAWAQSPPAQAPPSTQTPASAPVPAAGSVEAAQAAKAAAAAEAEKPTESDLFVDAAIKAISALKTISADVRQSVDMLDQRFAVKGQYRKGLDHRVYLKLEVVDLPDVIGLMLQVCDGKFLWDARHVLDSKDYRRIEVGPVFEKLKSGDVDDAMREQVLTSLGFAGPDEMLKGLRTRVRFNQPKTLETINGKEYWVLRGEWKSREGLTGPNQAPIPLTAPLPAYVPSLVVVTLGKQDNWPYKIRLVGAQPTMLIDTRPRGPDGRPIGSASSIQKVRPTEIELVYENVKLDTELADKDFEITIPNDVRFEDKTQEIVGMLDQYLLIRANQKKAEAAKGDESVLKEPIPVPRLEGKAPTSPSPLAPPDSGGVP